MKYKENKFQLTLSESRILNEIRRQGAISRKALADKLNLSPASVTNQTRELMTRGLIEKIGKDYGRIGQPSIQLALAKDIGAYAGFALTGDTLSIALVDFDGHIRASNQIKVTTEDSFKTAKVAKIQLLQTLETHHLPIHKLLGIGVALPTMFSKDNTKLLLSDSLGYWNNQHFLDEITTLFDGPIRFENDANAAAKIEMALADDIPDGLWVYLFLGRGIGGAINMGRNPISSAYGNAGEFGVALPRWFRRPTLDDLAKTLSQNGKPFEIPSLLDPSSTQNGELLMQWRKDVQPDFANLLTIITGFIDPNSIIVGGTMPPKLIAFLLEDITKQPTRKVDIRRLSMPPIKLAQYAGAASTAIGAACLSLDALEA